MTCALISTDSTVYYSIFTPTDMYGITLFKPKEKFKIVLMAGYQFFLLANIYIFLIYYFLVILSDY